MDDGTVVRTDGSVFRTDDAVAILHHNYPCDNSVTLPTVTITPVYLTCQLLVETFMVFAEGLDFSIRTVRAAFRAVRNPY